jgi:hypothetical protein
MTKKNLSQKENERSKTRVDKGSKHQNEKNPSKTGK